MGFRRLPIWVAPLLFFAGGASAAVEELRLDGFETGQTAFFQSGFVTGEVGAVRLTPTLACPCQVLQVTVLFGGAASTENVGVLVWDDPTGALDPGVPIFDGTATLTGSNQNLQQIDLNSQNVFVSGPFRVGIEFTHSGLPSIARDDDGIDVNNNFIEADILGTFVWFRSADLGVSGDWIIRATVESLQPEVPALSPWGLAVTSGLLLATAAILLFPKGRPARVGRRDRRGRSTSSASAT